MTSLHTIVTHFRPHLDEIVAIWLVRMFGEERFPGASTAKIELWNAGPFTPDGRSASDYEKEGYLLIGVGGGRLDEHATLTEHRKSGESAASLMAQDLGLTEDPRLSQLLRYVTMNDTQGGSGAFDLKAPRERKDAGAFHLAMLVNQLHRTHLDDVEAVIRWTSMFLDAHFKAQDEFHLKTREEYERLAQIQEVPVAEGQTIRLVSIQSDLEMLAQFARSPMAKGGPADILVQRRATGQVQIFTNKHSPVKIAFRDIVQVLRLKEQHAKKNVVTTTFDELAADGTIDGAQEWYYHQKAGMLLNGSLSAPHVPSTKLPLDFILQMIRVCVKIGAFEPKHKQGCKQGICTHESHPCDWYAYGLQRCRTIRFQMKNAPIPADRLVRKAATP